MGTPSLLAHHVLPLRIYWGVFLALVAGTLLTVYAAVHDLGAWNTPIALFIAGTKAMLVILFFMHVKYSSKLTWMFVAGGFIWFVIQVVITMTDYVSRSWL
jgi:cytochrome c oxidase subunit 4